MSERREGWYWIKLGDCKWEAAHWSGDGWEIVGIDEPLWDYKDLVISHRIPAPDEPWKCVPEEPTEEMVDEGLKEDALSTAYRAMLSASPKPEDV